MKSYFVHILPVILIGGVIVSLSKSVESMRIDGVLANVPTPKNVKRNSPSGDDIDIGVDGKPATGVPLPEPIPQETTLKPTSTPQPTTTPETTTVTPTTNSTTTTTTTLKPTTTPTNSTTTTKSTTTTTTTSQKPSPSTPTTESTTTTPAPRKERRFDGPSFIGGIILASGLMAIGFVSWKFYKARTERLSADSELVLLTSSKLI